MSQFIDTVLSEEIVKCNDDPLYFWKNHVWLNTAIGRRLMTVDYLQEKFIKHVSGSRLTCISADRQVGKTTTSLAYAIWVALFRKVKIAYVTFNNNSAEMANDNIRYTLSMMSNFLFMRKSEPDTAYIKFDTNQVITQWHINESFLTVASQGNALGDVLLPRGFDVSSCDILILDEYAHFDNVTMSPFELDKLVERNTGLNVLMISTPTEKESDFNNRLKQNYVRFEPLQV